MESREETSASGRLSLALKALEDGRVGQAMQLLQFAVTVNPHDAEAYYHLGRAHLLRDEIAQAEGCFRKASEIDSGNVRARCALAQVLLREGRSEEARTVLREALRLDPHCQEAQQMLEELPRPEDHSTLRRTGDDGLAPLMLASSGHRGVSSLVRSLVAGAGLLILLVSMLYMLQAFLQIRTLAPELPGQPLPQAEPAGGTSIATSPHTDVPSAVGTPPANEKETATQEVPASPAEMATSPWAGAEVLLAHVYAAQRQFYARHGRYGSLSELERNGLLESDVLSGPPQARYSYALLSGGPTGANAFKVTATLPDGSTLSVNESGRITRP